MTVNEYLSSTYDFLIPVGPGKFQRFGDFVLTTAGNPTDPAWYALLLPP